MVAALLALLVVVATAPLAGSSVVAVSQQSPVDRALSIGNGSVKAAYAYSYTIELNDVGGSRASITVNFTYVIAVFNVNETHVKVFGFLDGDIVTSISSPSYIALGAIYRWLGGNASSFIRIFTPPSINGVVVSKGELGPYLLGRVRVVPFRPVNASCGEVVLDRAVFNGAVYAVGSGGEAAYECRSGLLLYYRNTAPVSTGSISGVLTMYVELKGANIVRELIVGVKPPEGCPTHVGREPEPRGVFEDLNIVVLSAAALTASLAVLMAVLVVRYLRKR